MALSFYAGNNQLSQLLDSVVIIMGATRSGKSTLGNLLGSCRGVEHIDVSWLPEVLPLMARHGLLSESLAIQFLQVFLANIVHDRLLMRYVSFRPADVSSIWLQKTPEEIFTRLVGLSSREEVWRYAKENRSALVLNASNTLPFRDFFQKALPGCRIIHVVRDSIDVAFEVGQKRWLSDEECQRPIFPDLYRPYVRPNGGPIYYVPYWLTIGQEEWYFGLSEYARGLHYWRRLMEMAGVGTEQQAPESQRVVRFADMMDRPAETIEALVHWLGMRKTELTERLLAKVNRSSEQDVPLQLFHGIGMGELRAVKIMHQHFGMPTDKIDSLLLTQGA